MDNVIKKAFVVLPLVVIMLCAYFAARGTNNIIRVVLAEKLQQAAASAVKPAPAASAEPVKPPAPEPALSYHLFLGEPINQVDMGSFAQDAAALAAAEASRAAENPLDVISRIDCGYSILSGTACDPAPDNLGMLVGTIVSTNPLESSAIVVQGTGGKGADSEGAAVRSFEFNDVISASSAEGEGKGVVVMKICRKKVYLRPQEGSRLYCLTSADDNKRLTERSKTEEAPTEGTGVSQTSETEFQVSKSKIDEALSNMDKLSTQARMVPHFQGGKSVGFRIYAIKPGSLFTDIGLQNGDILEQINGMELNSPEKALEIYTKLKESSSVSINLKRRGKPMTMEYSIR